MRRSERLKSPMPFGGESCEDLGFSFAQTALLLLSPMPFGGESCEDKRISAMVDGLDRKSPMPFGGESCEDTAAHISKTLVSCVTNAFRRGVL